MINWKTSLTGITALLTSAAGLLHAIQTGDYSNLATILGGIAAGIGLIFAKDKNVTGGTIIQPTSQTVAVEKAIETKDAVNAIGTKFSTGLK